MGLLVGGGILICLMFYVTSHFDLKAILSGVKPLWIVAAMLCMPVYELIDGILIWSMGRRTGQKVSLTGCLDSAFIGEFYYRLGPLGAPVQLKLMLDAGFTGDGAAVVYTWKSAANTLVYALFASAALAVKLFWFHEDLGWVLIPTAVIIAGYLLILACVSLVAVRPERAAALAAGILRFLTRHIKSLQKENRGERAVRKVKKFCRLFQRTRKNRPMLLRLLAAMPFLMFCVFSVPAFLYFGLGLSGESFWKLLFTQCLVMVLSRVVMLPGNVGGAEGSFYLFMSPMFGDTVSVAMVLWRLATYVEVMVIGAVYSVIRFAVRAVRRS